MLAYIRLVINPRDDEAFRRIVNYPTRGIGDTTVERIATIAAQRGVSMWESVDSLVDESLSDPVQRTIARKVSEFVSLIRSLSLKRVELGIYDFGMEVALKSGILPMYRLDNSPESLSAIENIEELLNTMQIFKEQRDAEIRGGERQEDEVATIEEWMQQVMLMTDMDNTQTDDSEKVTLMTVHSSKGLEYKYVYIVGLEENLFPSQRAVETPDGLEEERRLFYVALTRAKCAAMLSYAESRFKWGAMEFSRPSCFIREIDPRYVESSLGEESSQRPQRQSGSSTQGASKPQFSQRMSIEEMRRRFDYRFKQKQERSPIEQYEQPAPERLRRVENAPSAFAQTAAPCPYKVGERVEHSKFGAGIIKRIESLAQDHKLVVEFADGSEKTLLSKFAKLKKL